MCVVVVVVLITVSGDLVVVAIVNVCVMPNAVFVALSCVMTIWHRGRRGSRGRSRGPRPPDTATAFRCLLGFLVKSSEAASAEAKDEVEVEDCIKGERRKKGKGKGKKRKSWSGIGIGNGK